MNEAIVPSMTIQEQKLSMPLNSPPFLMTHYAGSIFAERQAAWKILLPIKENQPLLAMGLPQNILMSLTRSWPVVHACQICPSDVAVTLHQLSTQGLHGRLVPRDSPLSAPSSYAAIAIGASAATALSVEEIFKMLVPGGAIAWIKAGRKVPSAAQIKRAGFEVRRKYAILPPGDFRFMIPLNEWRDTYIGLTFFLPGNAFNRMLVHVAQLLSMLNLQDLLGISPFILAQKPGAPDDNTYFLNWISRKLGCEVIEASVYSGTNEIAGTRKLTMQLLGRKGKVLGIAKIADMESVRKAIDREAEALRMMKEIRNIKYKVPQILMTGEWHNHAVHVQSAIGPANKEFCANLTPRHMDFLKSLTQTVAIEATLEEWPHWPKLQRWMNSKNCRTEYECAIVREIARCRNKLAGIRLPYHRIHGDFARWNILMGRDEFCVVDWEQSDSIGLPSYDLVYFLTRRPKKIAASPRGGESPLSDVLSVLKSNQGALNTYFETHASSAMRQLGPTEIEALTTLCAMLILDDLYMNLII
jgi:hypothetical protein